MAEKPSQIEKGANPEGLRVRSGGPVITRPRPRALALGLHGHELGGLETVFPTLTLVSNLSQVAQTDYDVLITRLGVPETCAEHLFVLAADAFDPKNLPIGLGRVVATDRGYTTAEFGSISYAKEFARPELPLEIADLVEDVIQSALGGHSSHRILQFVRSGPAGPFLIDWRRAGVRGFLVGSDNNPIAGSFKRPGESDCWALPGFVLDLTPWARAAVREWRSVSSDRFPGQPNLRHDERWATPQELELIGKRRQLQTESEQRAQQTKVAIKSLEEKLERIRHDGDTTHRVLLTSQADELVRGVVSALKSLGFVVEEIDNTGRSPKVEDLRIRDGDLPAWAAIGEVKGYVRGGARASDLLQVSKFQALFAAEFQRLPDASWYIVNHSISEDPEVRRPALLGADAEVAIFGESGGLVIDSRILFDLRSDVEAGVLSATEARELLRESRGRLSYGRRL